MNENSLKKGCYDYLKEALEKISYDKYNKKYMTHSKIEAYNFDNLKQVYTKKIHHSENGICSVDAIWMIGDKPVFIEFKNGSNYSEPYCPKIMSGVLSKAAFNALTAFMPFFFAVPM